MNSQLGHLSSETNSGNASFSWLVLASTENVTIRRINAEVWSVKLAFTRLRSKRMFAFRLHKS